MKGLIVTQEKELMLVDDIPMPQINEYEALVKMNCCMVCNGTDLDIIDGGVREACNYPLVLGHESVGRIIDLGSKVTSYKLGDLVLRPSLKDTDKYFSAWGGFSEFATVIDYDAAVRDKVDIEYKEMGITQQVVPDGITAPQASLMITLKETYSISKSLNVQNRKRMLILGDGPVGMCLLISAKLQGMQEVIMLGNHVGNLEIAKSLGASQVFLNKDISERKNALSYYHRKIGVVLDTIGNNDTITQCLDYLGNESILAIYGLKTEDNISFPAPELRNYSIRFVQWPNPVEERKAHDPIVKALLEGKIDTKMLITHSFPIERYQEGFDAIRERKALKVLLQFDM